MLGGNFEVRTECHWRYVSLNGIAAGLQLACIYMLLLQQSDLVSSVAGLAVVALSGVRVLIAGGGRH